MSAITAIIVAFVALIGWLVVSRRSPLGRWLDRRVTLDQAKLTRQFRGLLLFGKAGCRIVVCERRSGDVVACTLREMPVRSILVEMRSRLADRSAGDRLARALEAMGVDCRVASSGTEGDPESSIFVEVEQPQPQDPMRWEAIVRLATRTLGHRPDARYRLTFDGPFDFDAATERLRAGSV